MKKKMKRFSFLFNNFARAKRGLLLMYLCRIGGAITGRKRADIYNN